MIDLSKFCDETTCRYDLGSPWRVGEWIYATDGRILVRLDYEESYVLGDDVDRPSIVEGMLDTLPREWGVLPEISPPYADGLEDDFRYWHECPHCGHAGLRISRDSFFARVKCGARDFARGYLWMIHELPGVHVGFIERSDRLFFRFDGGVGCLEPMRREGK